MTHEGPIGITGATGYIGSHVARLLAERGIPQRLIARDPARLPSLLGAQTASVSSYGDAEGMRDALEGASTLFLASGRDAPNRVQQHMTAVDAHLLERLRHLMNVAP